MKMEKSPVCIHELITAAVSPNSMKKMPPKAVEGPLSRMENTPVNTRMLDALVRNEKESPIFKWKTPKTGGGL